MFKTILVATDLSEASHHVVGCLGALRAFGTEEVTLLHCLGIRHLEEIAHLLAPIVQPGLKAQKSALEKHGFRVNVELAAGLPKFEINRIAAERGASLVVVGSHGQAMSGDVRLGGVASEVIHNARTPVLIIRLAVKTIQDRTRCEVACSGLMQHVLFPTDFSDNAEHAFTMVKGLFARGAKRVTLMHVRDKGEISRELSDRLAELERVDRERLERMARDVGGAACELTHGFPASEIVARSAKSDVSLIVMGSQGRSFVSEVFLGSVSHQVARRAPVSVLLVPAIRR